jgi:hypothetical protein
MGCRGCCRATTGFGSVRSNWPLNRGRGIEYIAKTHIREDDVVTKLLAARGEHPVWCMQSRR